MSKNIIWGKNSFEKYGVMGEDTGINGLRVGDVVDIKGYNSIIVYDESLRRYTAMGFMGLSLEQIKDKVDGLFNVKYTFEKINNTNISDISGCNISIREANDGKMPIYISDIKKAFGDNIKLVIE